MSDQEPVHPTYRVHEETDGRWSAGPYGKCRRLLPTGKRGGQGYDRRSCPRPSVASLLRGRTGQRWGYCALHLAAYGRVLRDAAVWWDPGAAAVVKSTYPGIRLVSGLRSWWHRRRCHVCRAARRPLGRLRP